ADGEHFDGLRFLEVLEEIAESLRVAQTFEQRWEGAVVESACIAMQVQRDDAIPLCFLTAGTLAQPLGVVDLADLKVRSAAAGPRVGDPTIGQQILRCPGPQQEP